MGNAFELESVRAVRRAARGIAVLASAGALCAPALAVQGVAIPGGTEIPVRVVSELSSRTAKPGDHFKFKVAKNVIVRGAVVVRADADGEGEINNVERAGKSGRSGSLELRFDWVRSADGRRVALSPVPLERSERSRKLLEAAATAVGIATFGIGGLFAHTFVHGKEITISPATTLNAFTASAGVSGSCSRTCRSADRG